MTSASEGNVSLGGSLRRMKYRNAERQHADTAQIHHHDQNDARDRRQAPASDAMDTPTVPKAEAALKQTQVHRHVFDIRRSHRHRPRMIVTPTDREQRYRIHDAARLDGSSEGRDRRAVRSSALTAREREHCHRHSLEAARRRAGRAADQHEHARRPPDEGSVSALVVDGVEARRAQRHRLERRREQPVRHASYAPSVAGLLHSNSSVQPKPNSRAVRLPWPSARSCVCRLQAAEAML